MFQILIWEMLMLLQLTIGNYSYLICSNVLLFWCSALNTESWLFIHDEAPVSYIVYNYNDFTFSYIYIQHRVKGSFHIFFILRPELKKQPLLGTYPSCGRGKTDSENGSKGCYLKVTHIAFAHIQLTATWNMANLDGNRSSLYERGGETSMIFSYGYTAHIF